MTSLPVAVDDICYSRTFLTEVIARVDFLNPLAGVEEQLPPEIGKAALRHFPIAEPQKTLAREWQIPSPEAGITEKRSEFMQWRFHGRERDKTLTISPMAVHVTYSAYKTYEVLRDEFGEVVSAVLAVFRDSQGKRLGLRYINNVEIKEGAPTNWTGYFNPHMLCLFQLYPDSKALARVFHTMELSLGDFSLRYQFGMHNPDYPAAIRRKLFVLDFDAYYQGLQEQADLLPNLDRFHGKIQELFELSITDALRKVMNG